MIRTSQRLTSFSFKRQLPLSFSRLFCNDKLPDKSSMIKNFVGTQTKLAERMVPWFLDNMPPAYFRSVPKASHLTHLTALSPTWESDLGVTLSFENQLENGVKEVTIIRPGTHRSLVPIINELSDQNFYRMLEFKSKDNKIKMNTFIYKKESPLSVDKGDSQKLFGYAKELMSGKFARDPRHALPSPIFEESSLQDFIQCCSPAFIKNSSPRRFLKHFQLYDQVKGSEDCAVGIEKFISDDLPVTGDRFWIDQAIANSLPKASLHYTALLLENYGFEIERTHLDLVKDKNGIVALTRVLVVPPSKGDWVEGSSNWDKLAKDLVRVRWLDNFTLDVAFKKGLGFNIFDAEVVHALATINLNFLEKNTSLDNCQDFIHEALTKESNSTFLRSIGQLFKDKFNPKNPASMNQVNERAAHLVHDIEASITDAPTKLLLKRMIDVVCATYRTNFYMPSRYALSLRVDPKVLHIKPEGHPIPFGIFFSHGRKFNGFHIRFRDIARGGVRLVVPDSIDRLISETTSHFDEAWGLANAQQLKNKDIPEGGSKAVVLVNAIGMSKDEKYFQVRRSFKAFTDSLLDLLVQNDETRENIIDYYGRQEFLYLGPDENVIPDDIEWVINRAGKRGYPFHRAYMSSKAKDGINHKDFGVTSEGVKVFLDVGLRKLKKIDPTKEPFTVMITGGPDGDVGGNMIKILNRDYPNTCKIIAIADGSGCIEDPNGLNMIELLRLFEEAKGVSHFNPEKLTKDGNIFPVTEDNPDSSIPRNTMQFRNKADVFIPAGGRPESINVSNWEQFIHDGVPNAPIVVEGANLFTSEEARELLFKKANVLFMKDSSANKCGVICSSFEICSSMLIDSDTFAENKAKIVDEVLVKLRQLARLEAELLVREYNNFRGSLPHFSKKISEVINRATDAIATELDNLSDEQLNEFLPLFREHLPPTLVQLAFDEVNEKIPKQYLKNAFASCLASKIVYQEGIHFIQVLPEERLAQVAFKYMGKERKNNALINAVMDGKVDDEKKEKILYLLKRSGVRGMLDIC